MPGFLYTRFLKRCCTIDAWQDSKYCSCYEYGKVTQGSQQNARLHIFDRVLNMLLVWNGRVREGCEFCVTCILEIHGFLNILQVLNTKILNALGILIWFPQGILTRFLIYFGFWICQSSEFVLETILNSNIQGKLWKIRCWKCIYDLKPELFFQLWTIFILCEFLERVWEIMRHPWYCLAHHPSISSNITSATHSISTQPTPPTLATSTTLPTLAHLKWPLSNNYEQRF